MKLSDSSKQTIDKILDASVVGSHVLPNVTYTVADKDGIVYQHAAGLYNAKDSLKMTPNSIQFIASCTKLVTSIAAMQLVESGQVSLDDPALIRKCIPELATPLQVLSEDGTLKAAEKPEGLTLRSLLEHSSGFTYIFWNQKLLAHSVHNPITNEISGNVDKSWYQQPLVNEPGTEWHYGIGIDMAGIVVEKVSGMSLGEYFKKNIFEPLDIKDMFFGDAPERKHLAPYDLFTRTTEGVLEPTQHFPLSSSCTFHSGGAGLSGSPSSYIKILTSLLRGGSPILKPETVDLMFTNSLQPSAVEWLERGLETTMAPVSGDFAFYPGKKKGWGLSCLLLEEDLPGGKRKGTASWGGIANWYWTIDRATGIATLCTSQLLPFADPKMLSVHEQVEKELYAGLST